MKNFWGKYSTVYASMWYLYKENFVAKFVTREKKKKHLTVDWVNGLDYLEQQPWRNETDNRLFLIFLNNLNNLYNGLQNVYSFFFFFLNGSDSEKLHCFSHFGLTPTLYVFSGYLIKV